MSLEFEVNFRDGKVATCSAYFVCDSYRPLMAFWPGERADRAVFEASKTEAASLFGDQAPIAIVPPNIDLKDPERPFLPDCRFTGSFHARASDPSVTGSSVATIIWFQAEPFPILGPDVIENFAKLDWADLSIDVASEDM